MILLAIGILLGAGVHPGFLRFEDDLPAHANIDDLTASMAAVLVRETEAYLAAVAEFRRLYPEQA